MRMFYGGHGLAYPQRDGGGSFPVSGAYTFGMSADRSTLLAASAGFSQRRLIPEIMDDPGLDPALHRAALIGLSRINRVSRSASMLWPTIKRAFDHHQQRHGTRPFLVVDIACGGGDVLLACARLAAKHRVPVSWIGADFSEVAVDFARQQAQRSGTPIEFQCLDVLRDPLPADVGLAMNSLFMHHLDEAQAIDVLRKMADAAPFWRSTICGGELWRTRSAVWGPGRCRAARWSTSMGPGR